MPTVVLGPQAANSVRIISQSWGATENTLFTPGGAAVFASFEAFYLRAALEHVTVFASTGDFGSANPELNGTTFYSFPTVGFPASSPLVMAVGGTSLMADTSDNHQSETVWNNSTGASGGGISQVFHEPNYEEAHLPPSVKKELNYHRGILDIAYNADPNTSSWSTLVFRSQGCLLATTSSAARVKVRLSGPASSLMLINLLVTPWVSSTKRSTDLGASSDASTSFHDITVGNNSFKGVPGYNATPGWDLASGWGTPQATTLVTNLIKLMDRDDGLGRLSSDQ